MFLLVFIIGGISSYLSFHITAWVFFFMFLFVCLVLSIFLGSVEEAFDYLLERYNKVIFWFIVSFGVVCMLCLTVIGLAFVGDPFWRFLREHRTP